MAGLTLADIRAAIKSRLEAGINRETNIAESGQQMPMPRIRLVLAASDPIDYFTTMGPAGIARVRFDLVVEPAGTDKSAVVRLDDYLSVGTGNGSSVVDAILADRTLGGVVADCVLLGVSAYDPELVTATLPLEVRVAKIGAQT